MKDKTATNSTDDSVRNLVLHAKFFKCKKEEISLGMAGRVSRKQAPIAELPCTDRDEKRPLSILLVHLLP